MTDAPKQEDALDAPSPDPIAPKVRADVVKAAARVDADVLTTAGQRRINIIWERTQQIIAISVIETTLLVVAVLVLTPVFKNPVDETAATAAMTGMVLLANLAGIVIGFYFGRTNHQRIGGIGITEVSGQ